MSGFWARIAAWAATLAVGFWLVFAFGGGSRGEADELAIAYHPATPVSEAAARRSAETIVRIKYSDLFGTEPTVTRRTDFGVDRWVISYSATEPVVSGVRISIGVETGTVEAASFP